MVAQPEDVFNPTDDDPVYALAAPASFGLPGVPCFAARRSGLICSVDGGHTWLDAYQSLLSGRALTTSSVALSPDYGHDQIVFAGVHGGVVRSNDGGHSWRTAAFPPPAPLVVTLAVSPNFDEDHTVFAGTAEDGVFISIDGGATWAAWNFGLMDLNILCLAISPDFAADETLLAGTTSGLFVSTNGGRAWREATLPVDLPAVISLAVSDHKVYAGTEEHGLFRSSAGTIRAGMPWASVGENSLTDPINAIVPASGHPEPRELLILHGGELRFSRNSGETFQPWLRPGLPANFEVMAVAAPKGFGPDSPVLLGGARDLLVI